MIYIEKYPPSGLGNKLMDYNLLRQLASKLFIDFRSAKIVAINKFLDYGEYKFDSFFKKKFFITKDFIGSVSSDDILEIIKSKIAKGYRVELKTPILGDFFFDFLYQFPGDFIKNPFLDEKDDVCGIHFRGGDFLDWNPVAILPLDYYIDSIDFIKGINSNIIFNLFSDDREHLTFIKIKEYLESKKYKFNDCIKKNFVEEFFAMSFSNILISSPSTFSVMAGCTGKKKKIIHSEAWLNYSISREDKFWIDLKKTSNPYYSLWKVV